MVCVESQFPFGKEPVTNGQDSKMSWFIRIFNFTHRIWRCLNGGSEWWLLKFYLCWLHHDYTSSTAQGGGGSFKNEKPIGEVSCCGAKMAERTHWWIERWLSVSAFLSFSFSFSLSLSFAIYLQSYLSSHLPIYLSIHVAIVRFVYSPNY